MEIEQKHYIAIGIAIFVVGAAAIQITGSDNEPANNLNSSEDKDWQDIELEDVRNGEAYTVAELEKPVLLETFAVWCPTCTRQQEAVKEFEKDADVTSVSLDVDPNEDADKVRSHIQRNGFDWRYSIAPSEMSQKLAKEFGNVVLNPPSAPMILVCEEGARKLPNGVKPPSKLEEEVEKGC